MKMSLKLLTFAALFALLLSAPCARAGVWSFMVKESAKLGCSEVVKKAEHELAEQALRKALRSSTNAEIRSLLAAHGEEAIVEVLRSPAHRKLVEELGEDAGNALLRHGCVGGDLLHLAPTKEAAAALQKLELAEARALLKQVKLGAITPQNAEAVLRIAAETPHTAKLVSKYGAEAVVKLYHNPTTRKMMDELGEDAVAVLLRHGAAGEKLLALAPTAATISTLQLMTAEESQALAAPLMRGVVNERNIAKMAAMVKEYPKTTALLAGWGLYKLLPKDESGAADLPAWVPTPIADGLRACGYCYKMVEWCLNHPWCAGGCALLLICFNGSLGYVLWQLFAATGRLLYRSLRVRRSSQKKLTASPASCEN